MPRLPPQRGAQVTTASVELPRIKSRLSPNQIRSFWAAWGGWTMDGMDSFIYSLVLVPALRDLLPRSGIAATTANVGFYGSLLFALFMVGWGTGMVWGPIADRFGRVRTMMFSILSFSLFTLLAALSTGVWSLAVLRFLAGVGIGGFGWMITRLGQRVVRGSPEEVVARVATEQHGTLHVRRRHLAETMLLRGTEAPVALDLRFKGGRQRFEGAEALRIASVVVPKVTKIFADMKTTLP